MDEFIEEMDAAQEACYADFLVSMGLDDTDDVWNAFVAVWTHGRSWGEQLEYAYPS